MGRTLRAERVRDEQDVWINKYLAEHPERAEWVAKHRTNWFGRQVIITRLLGREGAIKVFNAQ